MIEMDKEERQHHAREILNNPLFNMILEKLEQDALAMALSASLTDHSAHQAQIAYIRALRSFRSDCEALLRNTPATKAAPA
jgi:hypothetical protein